MPRINFSTWLFRQNNRTDEVGDIARWTTMVKLYKPFKTYGDFAIIFTEMAPRYLSDHLPILRDEFVNYLIQKKKKKS
jgi:hypothetical protein